MRGRNVAHAQGVHHVRQQLHHEVVVVYQQNLEFAEVMIPGQFSLPFSVPCLAPRNREMRSLTGRTVAGRQYGNRPGGGEMQDELGLEPQFIRNTPYAPICNEWAIGGAELPADSGPQGIGVSPRPTPIS